MRWLPIAVATACLPIAGVVSLGSACAAPGSPPRACRSVCEDPEGESCQRCLEEEEEREEKERARREQRRREAPPVERGGTPGSY